MDLQNSKFIRVVIYSVFLVSILALIGSSSVQAQTSTDTPEPFSDIQTVTPAADGSVIHTVQAGESLNLIAVAYGITVGEIKQLNNLTSDMIQPGDRLLIRTVSTATPTLEATKTATQPLPTSTRRPTRTPTVQPPVSPTLEGSPTPSAEPTHSPIMMDDILGNVLLVVIVVLAVAGVVMVVIGSVLRRSR